MCVWCAGFLLFSCALRERVVDGNLQVDSQLAQLAKKGGGNAFELSRNVEFGDADVKGATPADDGCQQGGCNESFPVDAAIPAAYQCDDQTR